MYRYELRAVRTVPRGGKCGSASLRADNNCYSARVACYHTPPQLKISHVHCVPYLSLMGSHNIGSLIEHQLTGATAHA